MVFAQNEYPVVDFLVGAEPDVLLKLPITMPKPYGQSKGPASIGFGGREPWC